jgi:hypothetical protein
LKELSENKDRNSSKKRHQSLDVPKPLVSESTDQREPFNNREAEVSKENERVPEPEKQRDYSSPSKLKNRSLSPNASPDTKVFKIESKEEYRFSRVSKLLESHQQALPAVETVINRIFKDEDYEDNKANTTPRGFRVSSNIKAIEVVEENRVSYISNNDGRVSNIDKYLCRRESST